MKRINCSRCDKKIPEMSCFCQECVDKIADWRVANALADHYFNLWNKAKAKVLKLRK